MTEPVPFSFLTDADHDAPDHVRNHHHDAPRPTTSSARNLASLAALFRRRSAARAALLSVDRRQGRALRRRDGHQIFLEPEGLDDDTVYPNGISTSLPRRSSGCASRTIPGLERVGDHAAGLRDRIRLRRSARADADARRPSGCRGSISPARSTARPAMRRRARRAWSPGSTRRARPAAADAFVVSRDRGLYRRDGRRSRYARASPSLIACSPRAPSFA